ncbi:hypothetical protein FCM35_KLT17391 [Carex littledalei]|uniref:DUF4220 domain-containing protein n=1 Tax=Carex littledalei TaxID=544730 RepID=A0A833RRC1_9POAL|nr:hypothetical protein FCM35_KLT17391 [Carex littledalei]
MNTGQSIEALLIALKTDDAKLARAEFLVVLGAILMVLLFIMDGYRLRSNSSFVRNVLVILETVTSPLVTYTVGLLQNLSFTNHFLGIWGVLLYILQSGTEYITAYSINDTSIRRRTALKDLVLTFFAGNLNATKGSNFQGFLWVLWSLGPIMIFYKIFSFERACRSYSHGQNSKLLVEYMKNEPLLNQQFEWQPDPTNMRGYLYMVRGENDQEIIADAPTYQVKMDIKNKRKFITLEAVWNCPGHLLRSLDQQLILKDVCLSYALHKLQRCEMDDLSLSSECHKKTQKLFFKGVLLDKENDKRVFRIMEMQIAFLNDYSYTRLPISVWYGYPLIKLGTLLVTTVIAALLAFKIHGTDTTNDFHHLKKGHNIDRTITYVLLVFIVLKEIWEMALYIFSDWTKLLIICRYVEGSWFLRNRLVEHIILLLCRLNLVKRWHNKMAQYNFLESFDYKPWVKRTLHYGTLSMVKKPTEGGKVGKTIKMFEEVKQSIVEALRNIKRGDLINGMPWLYKRRVRDNYQWACSQQTNSHLILVWHIATSMCEIQLSEELIVERPWLNSLLHKLKVCGPHRNPFLVDLKRLGGRTRAHYIVANSISRYCAYLLVSVPELLPDHAILSGLVFEGAVKEAQSFLRGCDSLKSVLAELMKRGEGAGENDTEGRSIVDEGAKLGMTLLADQEMNVEARWKMLADFWVNVLLFLAPSKMIEDHRSHLHEGGEFITLLWALFSNCGVFDRAVEDGSPDFRRTAS